jgi:undecaprenyl diphosphate synthase
MTLPVPEHLAIIMDGNGRWAENRRRSRNAGHRAGARSLKKLAAEAEKLGIGYLTVYAFSTENWTRPPDEVSGLMRLMREYIQQYIDDTKKNNMRISVIGDRSGLEPDLREKIARLEEISANKPGLRLTLAVNYGGRDEIVRAARQLARQGANGELGPDTIDESVFAARLDTASLPDPDLLIRTAGEMRLSNFLLWQLAYTEIYISEKLWPDFNVSDLKEAIHWFANRERRFGGR